VCEKCGGALLFQYDLVKVAEAVTREMLEGRGDSFWKFIELLPLSSREQAVSLGEPYTPVLPISVEGVVAPEWQVFVKDDGRLPTGTFKARGMAMAVSCLREFDVKDVVMPSAGNAAGALAAYGSKAGLKVHVFLPEDVPESNLKECVFAGAEVYLVDGLINDAAAMAKRYGQHEGWYDLSTNKQPYRFEGYKAMAFETTEQFAWDPPDVILFPTGGGEGIIGLWKGFKELFELGWIENAPRLIAVQSTGCAPLVKAFREGDTEVKEEWENAETIASGLRVPYPYASYLTLRAIRETGGVAVDVEDEEIQASMKAMFQKGVYACPEAAATLAALGKYEDLIHADETILLYVTGSAMKYYDSMKMNKAEIPLLRRETL
jgi:threonine synthase